MVLCRIRRSARSPSGQHSISADRQVHQELHDLLRGLRDGEKVAEQIGLIERLHPHADHDDVDSAVSQPCRWAKFAGDAGVHRSVVSEAAVRERDDFDIQRDRWTLDRA